MDKNALHSQSSEAKPSLTEWGGRLRRIFVGSNGIRAGWGALLFAAIFVGVDAGLVFIARHFLQPPADDHILSPTNGLLTECINLCAVTVATAILAAIERRSLFFFGLQGSARGIRFLSGAVFGFAAISVLVLLLWRAGLLQLDASTAHGAQAWKYAAIWAIVFAMTGVFEESLLRGYLQYTLARGMGFWRAAVLLSLLFGAMHGVSPGETPVGILAATLFGLILCMTLWYTGSLWWAIGFHAAWDWGESAVYGTSDSGRLMENALFTSRPLGNVLLSGGATGPEGSLLILPFMAVVAILIWARWGWNSSSSFAHRGLDVGWTRGKTMPQRRR